MLRQLIFLLAVLLVATPAFAKGKQYLTLEILQPKPDQELTGTVDVHVRFVKGTMPTIIRCGIGGEPWMKLRKLGEKNEWVGKIDSTMVPNGPQTLLLLTDIKKSYIEVPVSVQNPLNIYFADLHAHTRYSDGTLTPSDAFDYARNMAKLDVFVLTDHLERVDETEWLDTRKQAFLANENGKFVTIAGLEWSKQQGHANIFDPKTRHWPKDVKGFYKAVAKSDVIVKFNHPGNGEKVFNGLAYSKKADRVFQLMEVRVSKEEQAYLRALKLGWHLAPDGSDDTHRPNWGDRRAWTGILAPGLSQRNIWDALKNRRCYSTADRNCRLSFEVNGATMGEIIKEPVETIAVKVAVEDPDAQDKILKIELFKDGKIVQTEQPKKSSCRWITTCLLIPGEHYYFVKVTQADGNRLWSAPIWLKVGEKSEASKND